MGTSRGAPCGPEPLEGGRTGPAILPVSDLASRCYSSTEPGAAWRNARAAYPSSCQPCSGTGGVPADRDITVFGRANAFLKKRLAAVVSCLVDLTSLERVLSTSH